MSNKEWLVCVFFYGTRKVLQSLLWPLIRHWAVIAVVCHHCTSHKMQKSQDAEKSHASKAAFCKIKEEYQLINDLKCTAFWFVCF